MLQNSPLETYPPESWLDEDMPKLRMVSEDMLTSQPVVLRQAQPESEPSALLPQEFKQTALIVACVLLAPVLLYFMVDRLVVTKVTLPAAHGLTSRLEESHYLRRYCWAAPQRGDRVVTSDHSELAVQRIIARPSDCLKLTDGAVYLNGMALPERLTSDSSEKLIQLGENQYYVVGERPGESDPTASHGVVYRQNILGRLAK